MYSKDILDRQSAVSTTIAASSSVESPMDAEISKNLEKVNQGVLTGVLKIKHNAVKAGIIFVHGKIVHAFFGPVKSKKALFRIFSLKDSDPHFQFQSVVLEHTIFEDMDQLIEEWIQEHNKLQKVPARLLNALVKVNSETLKEHPKINKQPGLIEILSLLQQHDRIQEVLDNTTLTDLETWKRIIYLRKLKVLNIHEFRVKTQLITDSTADLPPEIIRDNDIIVMPLSISIDGNAYRDGIDIDPSDFYKLLKQCQSFPTTSPITEQEFNEVYKRVSLDSDILGVFLSQKMSLTFENARAAAMHNLQTYTQRREEKHLNTSPPQVEIINSKVVTMGLGLLVLEAADKIKKNWPARKIRTYIESLIPKVQIFFLVDTLEYLKRGGRIGKAKALLGNLLGIKPILTVQDGEVSAAHQARGIKRGQRLMEDLIHDKLMNYKSVTPISVSIVHANAPEWAEEMKKQISKRYDCIRLIVSQIGPTVGAHCGPGTVCVTFIPMEDYYD